ncbi:hypothetical protein niasHT_034488 [Heterodera trifolii]|uniref:Protein kinase domain-containing protein n=1 Tax=Heterodera trifolii TaxID=157864 RepID=A0ABD2I7X8_9BILA
MAKLTLTNLEDKKPIELRFKEDDVLGEGTYSKVFHVELKSIGTTIFNKCVALKMTRKDLESSDWQKHTKEWKIQKAFDQLKEQKHVIKLFAYGYHKTFVFSVLELGRGNLIKHMKKRRIQWLKSKSQLLVPDDWKIEPDIRQLVETVRDMHQKIMHLDLKPSNLVFVREGTQSLMKAIDFGASQFIDEYGEQRNSAEKQANACKWFVSNDPLTTEWYQSPEHYNQCNWKYNPMNEHSMELSSKSDIWAIGIIAIEMAAIGTEFKGTHDEGPEKDAKEIVPKVYGVIEVLWRIYIQNTNDIDERMEKNWDEFYANFSVLLSIRAHFPRLFHIVTAVLVYEPERRPTANGILDFLDGKCRFESMQNASRLLPWLTMEQFKMHLRKQKNLLKKESKESDGSRSSKELLKKQMEELKILLRLANAKEWVPGEKQREKPCDTTTNKAMNSQRHNQRKNGGDTTPRATNARSAKTQSGGWKDGLAKIEKTIGLSLSPSIQYEFDKIITEEFLGIFENLQESFYNSNFEIFELMGQNFAALLWSIGYGKLLEQLDKVSERNKSEAEMLKSVVDSVRGQLGTEWAEIYEMAAQYECDEGDKTYTDTIHQISAFYLYELMNKQLLDKFSAGSELNDALSESHRATFLFKWLRDFLKNLKKFRIAKQKLILETLRNRREQFEKKMGKLQREIKEIFESQQNEYENKIYELEEIEELAKEEMEHIESKIEQNKTKLSSRTEQQRRKKNKKTEDGELAQAKRH